MIIRLKQLTDAWKTQVGRKDDVVERMISLLRRLREDDPNIPPPTAGVISEKNIARLLGETGPLSDFADWRRLMRYGGLNIRTRQSGKYQGQNKISKKGRPLMRKVLQNIALAAGAQRVSLRRILSSKKRAAENARQ